MQILACGPAPPPKAQTAAICPEKARPAAPDKAEPPFAITFNPSLDPPALGVRVRAKARGGLRRWASVARARPETLSAKDAKGAIAATWTNDELLLERDPDAFLELAYVLPARAQGDVVVSNSGFVRFYGEPILVPVELAKETTHVTIDFDLDKAPVESVASSFGSGKHVEAELAPVDLSKGAWMAGAVFTARFDAYEGKDDFSWIGYSAFDPRWVSAEIATLRTSVSQWFDAARDPSHLVPMSMLFTIDRRTAIQSSPISIYPRWHGMFAIVDLDAPWSIAARMSVALSLVSRFIARPAPPSPGYARYAAREILLASGTMTPLEYADEINGEIASTLFADKNPAAASLARDALDANRIDALARKASGGKRTMRQMLREWIATGAMETVAGDAPDDMFGKCFARVPMRFDELDLGFDEARTRAEKKLAGVHGAAQKAGLRDGEPLVSIRYDEGQSEHPVRVVVTRDGNDVEVKYRPIGRSKNAQGWRLVPGIDPSSCAR